MDKITHGYSCCLGHFQSKLDAIFIGMEGVTGIADDIVIAAETKWNMTEIS